MRKILIFLALPLAAHFAAAAPGYTAVRIPGADLYGTAINDSGVVVGYYFHGFPVERQAFVWQGGVTSDLAFPGSIASTATGINNSGEITGIVRIDNNYPGFIYRGGQFSLFGSYSDYGDGPVAINAPGNVAGTDADGYAFYRRNGNILRPDGDKYSSAFALNDRGQVVGQVVHENRNSSTKRAAIFFQKPSKNSVAEIPLPPDLTGYIQSNASGINASGQIVGTGSGIYKKHGYRYFGFISQAGATSYVGSPGSTTYPSSLAINNRGQIVATVKVGDGSSFAALRNDSRFLDLNKLAPLPAGVSLDQAAAINSTGQILTRGSDDSGNNVCFVLTPVATAKITTRPPGATASNAIAIHGRATGKVKQIVYRVGFTGRWKTAAGKARWHLLAQLRPGKNFVNVIARTAHGDSPPDQIAVTRR